MKLFSFFFLPVRFRSIQDRLFSFPSSVCKILRISFVPARNKTIKRDFISYFFPPVIIAAFSISEQCKTSRGFYSVASSFHEEQTLLSHDAVALLEGGSPREHRRALTTHCTANSQGAWEQIESSRCISGSTGRVFLSPPGVFVGIKKKKTPTEVLRRGCRLVFCVRTWRLQLSPLRGRGALVQAHTFVLRDSTWWCLNE